MNQLHAVLFIILSILATSCQDSVDPATKAVNEFQNDYILEQFEKYGFLCTVTGGGCYPGKEGYGHIRIGFITHDQLQILSARKAIVQNVLDYINKINSNTELEMHFAEWPVQPKNIVYTIRVDRGDGGSPKYKDREASKGNISYVNFLEGSIDYIISKDDGGPPETLHSETLDEAIAILKAEGWKEPAGYNTHVN